MGKLIFITGGARSGKSGFALKLAEKRGRNAAYIATGEPKDSEMKRRISAHRKSKPKEWITCEEPLDPASKLLKLDKKTGVAIIDCITLLVSNLVLAGIPEPKIIYQAEKIAENAGKSGFDVIVVSNELGSGVVPENKLARDFRDTAGRVNQLLAKASDKAYLMVSGLPVKLK